MTDKAIDTDAIVAAMQPAMDSLERLDRMLQVAVDALYSIACEEEGYAVGVALSALQKMAGLREWEDKR